MPAKAVSAAVAVLLLAFPQQVPAQPSEKPAAAELEQWLASGQVHDPPEPFRRRSVVLLHGFGGSPYDVRPLFEALTEDGFRLAAPLIPGEGAGAGADSHPSADALVSWLNDLLDKEKARFGRPPHLVGFSKGGALAVLAAAEGRAARVVLVSPYFGLPRGDELAEKGSRMVSPLVKTVPKPWKGRINDPDGYRRYEPGRKSVSLDDFLVLQELARRARAALKGPVAVPLLVLASPDDDVASFEETSSLFSGRPGAELKSFPGSNHILLYDYAAAGSVSAARAFLTAGED